MIVRCLLSPHCNLILYRRAGEVYYLWMRAFEGVFYEIKQKYFYTHKFINYWRLWIKHRIRSARNTSIER